MAVVALACTAGIGGIVGIVCIVHIAQLSIETYPVSGQLKTAQQ